MLLTITILVGVASGLAGFILGHYCGYNEALKEFREKTRKILDALKRN